MGPQFLLAFTVSEKFESVDDFATFVGLDQVIGVIGYYFGWETGENISLYIERWTSENDGADAFTLFLNHPNPNQGTLFEDEDPL